MQDADEVRDGQHPHEALPAGVPQGGSADAVVHQSVESLLHQKLGKGNSMAMRLRASIADRATMHGSSTVLGHKRRIIKEQ